MSWSSACLGLKALWLYSNVQTTVHALLWIIWKKSGKREVGNSTILLWVIVGNVQVLMSQVGKLIFKAPLFVSQCSNYGPTIRPQMEAAAMGYSQILWLCGEGAYYSTLRFYVAHVFLLSVYVSVLLYRVHYGWIVPPQVPAKARKSQVFFICVHIQSDVCNIFISEHQSMAFDKRWKIFLLFLVFVANVDYNVTEVGTMNQFFFWTNKEGSLCSQCTIRSCSKLAT